MNISILGLGWLGHPLALTLLKKGHQVRGTTRSEEKKRFFESQSIPSDLLVYPELPPGSLFEADAVILNIPPFEGQIEWFKRFQIPRDVQIIFVSSTSVYGNHSELKTEVSEIQMDTQLAFEEKWIQENFKSWCILRCSGLIGGERHPGKSLSGKKNIKGRKHPVNLIHLDDVIGFILTLIDQNVSGQIFNVSSDEHRNKEFFYSDFAQRMGLPLPEFDNADDSDGKTISNEKMKQIYSLKFPTMT